MKKKPSFFERLTGSVSVDEMEIESDDISENKQPEVTEESWLESSEGELSVDVHQTEDSVIVKTMVAGVDPDDLEVTVTLSLIHISEPTRPY